MASSGTENLKKEVSFIYSPFILSKHISFHFQATQFIGTCSINVNVRKHACCAFERSVGSFQLDNQPPMF